MKNYILVRILLGSVVGLLLVGFLTQLEGSVRNPSAGDILPSSANDPLGKGIERIDWLSEAYQEPPLSKSQRAKTDHGQYSDVWVHGAAADRPETVQLIQAFHSKGVLRDSADPLAASANPLQFRSSEILSGRLRVRQNLIPTPIAGSRTDAGLLNSRGGIAVRNVSTPSPRVSLCTTVAPSQEHLVPEWIHWHRGLGVRRFIVVALSVRVVRTLRTAWKDAAARPCGSPESSCELMTDLWDLEKSLSPAGAPPESQRSTRFDPHPVRILERCFSIATKATSSSADTHHETGQAYLAVLSITDFIHLPSTATGVTVMDQLGSWRRKSLLDGKIGFALPRLPVTHSGEWAFHHRTQLQRTKFGMGDVKPGSSHHQLRAIFLLSALKTLLPKISSPSFRALQQTPAFLTDPMDGLLYLLRDQLLYPTGEALSEVKSHPARLETIRMEVRVLSYTVRSFSEYLLEQLEFGPPRSRMEETSSTIPFDLGRIYQSWLVQKGVGFSNIASYNEQLRSLHRDSLLPSLYGKKGATGERIRALIQRDTKSFTPEQQRSLALLFGLSPTKQEEYSRISNQALLSRKISIPPEVPVNLINHDDVNMALKMRTAMCHERDPSVAKLPPPTEVVFCTFVRNRAKLTVEWLLWHLLHGVDRFYVFDDDSSDGLAGYLAPFIEKGVVRLLSAPKAPPYRFRDHPVAGPLLHAYGMCCDLEAHRQSWIGLIDSDEFLILPHSFPPSSAGTEPTYNYCLQDLILETTNKSQLIGGIAVPWKMVGHRGELFDDKRTQFERTGFGSGSFDHLQRVKVLVRADLPVAMDTAHKAALKPPFMTAFPDGSQLVSDGWWTGLSNDSPVYSTAFLMHFHARSAGSWIQKHLDGFADGDARVHEDEFWSFDLMKLFSLWSDQKEKSLPKTEPRPYLKERHKSLLKLLGYPEE